MGEVSYMDCWHYIAPLIPVAQGDELSQKIYLKVFRALKEADEREKEEEDRK